MHVLIQAMSVCVCVCVCVCGEGGGLTQADDSKAIDSAQ